MAPRLNAIIPWKINEKALLIYLHSMVSEFVKLSVVVQSVVCLINIEKEPYIQHTSFLINRILYLW